MANLSAVGDTIAFLHQTDLRDYRSGNRMSSEIDYDKTLIHESGHALFNLMDEYCCDSSYSQQDCVPNIWSSLAACQADAPNLGYTAAAYGRCQYVCRIKASCCPFRFIPLLFRREQLCAFTGQHSGDRADVHATEALAMTTRSPLRREVRCVAIVSVHFYLAVACTDRSAVRRRTYGVWANLAQKTLSEPMEECFFRFLAERYGEIRRNSSDEIGHHRVVYIRSPVPYKLGDDGTWIAASIVAAPTGIQIDFSDDWVGRPLTESQNIQLGREFRQMLTALQAACTGISLADDGLHCESYPSGDPCPSDYVKAQK